MRITRSFPLSLALAGAVFGAPYHGDLFTLKQPDGALVKARAFGDEYYVRLESLDGYTLTQDPATRRIEYARLDASGKEFVSTGIPYLGNPGVTGRSAVPAGLAKAQELPAEVKREKHARNLALLQTHRPRKAAAPGGDAQILAGPLQGAVKGVTLLIDFSDDPATLSQTEIGNYLNQRGYTGFGNNGSIRDYYYDVSGGKLDYTNYVSAYYRAQHPKTYYTDPAYPLGQRAQELIREALQALDAQGFDFSTLSVDAGNNIRAINMFYAGFVQNAWAQGLWPHQSYMSGFSADGVSAGAYQTTNIGSELTIATFCHENGHMLFGWPDLYDQSYTSNGAGNYCLMAYQGPAQNPVPPDPWLRAQAGWETPVTLAPPAGPTLYTATANALGSFRWNNPSTPNEYFLIESRRLTGRSAGLPDEGLLIWHIDEAGSNSCSDMSPTCHYAVSVEQADGLFEIEHNIGYGGAGDLFKAGYRSEFANWTVPDSKWWSGEPSGLNVVDIGPVGATQAFTVQTGEFRSVNIGNPGQAGTLSESGGVITMEGGGADISGTADQFFYRYLSLRGDGEILARVQSLENTNAWAKAGVMIRESTAPGARNAMMTLTYGNGVSFQYRATAGSTTSETHTAAAAPRWVRLVRRGAAFSGYHSADGITWSAFGTANIPMGENALIGLAVTSHNNATLATAVFTNFRAIPSPWTAADIGAPALAGSYGYDPASDGWTVKGAGSDIWNASDQFYFLRQPLTGDGRIVARLNSLTNTNAWAKAGVMIRSAPDANAANAFMGVTVSNGATFQQRPTAGAATTSTVQTGIAPPRWIKLEARNGQITGFQSANGTSWTQVATMPAFAYAYAGLAVTSHNTASLATAAFDKVDIQRGFPSPYLGPIDYVQVTGNGDYDVNPGETFDANITLINGGTATARGVTAVLSTTDPCISLSTASANYGDIPVNATNATRAYRFSVPASCPSGNAAMNLRLTETSGDAYDIPFTIAVVIRSTISGRVSSPAGPAPAGAYVACSAQRESYSGMVQADGSYIVTGVPAGTWQCSASATGYAYSDPVTVTVPPNRTGLDFVLSRARITANRIAFAETLSVGQSRTVALTVGNAGDAPLTFQAFNPQSGYVWRDSDMPGGPAYAWTDIAATGTLLPMNQGMSGAVSLMTLSFAFPFYGAGRSDLLIAPHGYVAFGDDYPQSYNSPLPAPWAPANLIAGFWDDIQGGSVYFQEFSDRAVVQWNQVPRLSGAGLYTFQIVLYKTGVIRFQYKDMGPADGATVGIQNATRDRALQIVSDAAYAKNNLAVELRPLAQEWLTITPASGTVAPAASTALSIGFNAAGLAAGTYKAGVTLTSNDYDQPTLSLPAQLTVIGTAAGSLRREVWNGITGAQLTSLYASTAWPNSPGTTGTVTTFESPQNAGDNFGERLRGYITAPTTGDYTFWIAGDDQCELRLSTDAHPGRAVVIAKVSTYSPYRGWTNAAEQKSALIRLNAGTRYYIEARHKEGTGGDHLSVGWQGPGITGDAERPIPGTRLTPFDPAAWTGIDIGNPGVAGSQTGSGSSLGITGGGADIWGASDQFRFVYKPLTGDGEITARVVSVQNTDVWSKGGVMIREALTPDARHALMAVSSASGIAFQRRLATAGTTSHTGATGAAPRWARVRRVGNAFTAFASADGTTWTQVGSDTIAMGSAVYIGLAVTSHNNAVTATDAFDNVSATAP
jgi:M6 family metalloprotease-like protein